MIRRSLIAYGLFLAVPLLPVASVAAPAVKRDAGSAFLGLWELDLSRMPDTYGTPPKRVTYAFEALDAERWRTMIVIVGADGGERRVTLDYRRDGRMVTGQGDTVDGDSAAFHSPAPNVLVMSVAKDRHLGSVRTYAVSADGRTMTESAANVDDAGRPFVRNFHYRRLR